MEVGDLPRGATAYLTTPLVPVPALTVAVWVWECRRVQAQRKPCARLLKTCTRRMVRHHPDRTKSQATVMARQQMLVMDGSSNDQPPMTTFTITTMMTDEGAEITVHHLRRNIGDPGSLEWEVSNLALLSNKCLHKVRQANRRE